MPNRLLSIVPVPFVLKPEQVGNSSWCYREPTFAYARQLNFYGGTLLVIGLVIPSACFLLGTVAVSSLSVALAVSVVILTSTGIWFLWKASRVQSRQRLLCVDTVESRVRLQLMDNWGVLLKNSSANLADVRLSVRPVSLRSGSALVPSWRGWAQVVEVDGERFILACDSRRDNVEQLIHTFPGVENARIETDMEELVGFGLVRVNRRRES